MTLAVFSFCFSLFALGLSLWRLYAEWHEWRRPRGRIMHDGRTAASKRLDER